jgi:PAS domain-containing protein
VFELVPPERAELLAARYRAALSGERVSVEVADSRGQPDHGWAIDVVPIRGSDGAVAGGMAVARDVTEQREGRVQKLGSGRLPAGSVEAWVGTVTLP